VWLNRWIAKNDYADPKRSVGAEELDRIIHDFSLLHPQRGERMVIGYIRSLTIRTTREEVRIIKLPVVCYYSIVGTRFNSSCGRRTRVFEAASTTLH
jgi:hypothetical protein